MILQDANSIHERFSEFGSVAYSLPTLDKQTGLPKGTAFIKYRYANEPSPEANKGPRHSVINMQYDASGFMFMFNLSNRLKKGVDACLEAANSSRGIQLEGVVS